MSFQATLLQGRYTHLRIYMYIINVFTLDIYSVKCFIHLLLFEPLFFIQAPVFVTGLNEIFGLIVVLNVHQYNKLGIPKKITKTRKFLG